MIDVRVDARNAECPVPILKAVEALKDIDDGQMIELMTTDDGSIVDVPAWASDMGYVIEETFETGGATHFVIIKA